MNALTPTITSSTPVAKLTSRPVRPFIDVKAGDKVWLRAPHAFAFATPRACTVVSTLQISSGLRATLDIEGFNGQPVTVYTDSLMMRA